VEGRDKDPGARPEGRRVRVGRSRLFLYTGVRRAEAARIRIVDDANDIDFGQKLLHVKIGKRRPRTLPLPDQLMEVLGVFNAAGKRPKFEEGDEDGGGNAVPWHDRGAAHGALFGVRSDLLAVTCTATFWSDSVRPLAPAVCRTRTIIASM
jgi:hypothetical protein